MLFASREEEKDMIRTQIYISQEEEDMNYNICISEKEDITYNIFTYISEEEEDMIYHK